MSRCCVLPVVVTGLLYPLIPCSEQRDLLSTSVSDPHTLQRGSGIQVHIKLHLYPDPGGKKVNKNCGEKITNKYFTKAMPSQEIKEEQQNVLLSSRSKTLVTDPLFTVLI